MSILETLKQWQPLLGAMLGGVFALSTAFIVAGSARRREQRIAAVLLTVDLMQIMAAAEQLRQRQVTDEVTPNQYTGWLSEKLRWRRPQLATSFREHVAQVVDIDASLSAHLNLLHVQYAGIEEHLTRVQDDSEERRRAGSAAAHDDERFMTSEERRAHSRLVAQGFTDAVEHAKYAQHYLERIVLSRTPRFVTRIKIHMRPNSLERASAELLEVGRAERK